MILTKKSFFHLKFQEYVKKMLNFNYKILILFVFLTYELSAKESFMYTCKYKSTEYSDHIEYGNESHFLDEYSKVIGWIKVSESDAKISGIGWSQAMKFSSLNIDDNFINITFQSKFGGEVLKESKLRLDRESGELLEYFFKYPENVSNKYNIYICKL